MTGNIGEEALNGIMMYISRSPRPSCTWVTSAQTMCGTGFSNLQSMSYGRCAFGSQMSSPFPTNQEKMKLLRNIPFNYVFPITRGKAAQGISLMAIHYKIYLCKIQMAVVLMCPLRLNVSVLPRTTSRWENKDQTAQI